MSQPWMPLYVGDYLADTGRLSTIEHGAYILLIMDYWRNGGLPDDDRRLARVARMADSDWMAIRENIADFFLPGWKHKRIDQELEETRERSLSARKAAEERWKKKRNAPASKPHSGPPKSADAESMPVTTTHSEAEASGAKAPSADYPIDPKERVWAEGVDRLLAMGSTDRLARSMIGKWLKIRGDPGVVLDAIRSAHRSNSRDPVPFVESIFSSIAKPNQKDEVVAAARKIREGGYRIDGPPPPVVLPGVGFGESGNLVRRLSER